MAQQAAKFAVSNARKMCRSLLDAVNDVIIIFDRNSLRVLDANESAIRVYGYSKEEFVRKGMNQLTHEVPITPICPVTAKASRERISIRQARKLLFSVSLSAIDYWGRKAVLSINRDISERKRIEAVIASNEKRLRLLITGISEIVALIDAKGVVRFISPQAERVLGINPSDLKGRSVFDFVHPDERQRVATEYAKTVQEPGEAIPSVGEAPEP